MNTMWLYLEYNDMKVGDYVKFYSNIFTHNNELINKV